MKVNTAIIYYPGFLSRVGGAFFHARNMEAELRKLGWKVEIVTLDSLPIWCRYVPHLVQVTVNLFRMPFGFLLKSSLIKILFKRFFNRKVDLRVFEDVYIAWNANTPTLTMLHAVWSDNLQAFAVNPKRLEVFKAREARIVNALDQPIVTVSYPYRKYLEEEHFSGQLTRRIDVIELGRDQSGFRGVEDGRRKGKSVVYSGVLEARKNLFFLLDVFEKLTNVDPEFALTIIGDGPDRKRLMEVVQSKKLPVRFLGKLTYESVVSELHRHDLYLHTSVKESFSYSLLEAKLAGLKTCAYSGLQVPEEFIDQPVPVFTVQAWCDALVVLDQSRRRDFDAQRFSARRMTLSSLELLNIPSELRPSSGASDKQ